MTFEEAKKILEKEGFELDGPGKPHTVSEYFTEFEDPNIYEAMQVVSSAGYSIIMLASRLEARKARLKKELEDPANAPVSGKEKAKEGNPALKESASLFNDALLDEQSKKIEELTKEKTNLEDKIAILNACKEHNKNVNRKRIKRLSKEIAKLNSIIHDKNAVLSDVAEELRLSKIREKNLTGLCQKYVGENEKLKKELADKVVDKIDAQALKSAESALAYKDKVIADLTKKLNVKHKKYVYYNGTIVAVHRLVNTLAGYAAKRYYKELCEQMVDIAEEGGDQSASIVVQCDNGITLSKEEAEIIERCTKNGTELHYSEKDGFTYTNVFGKEMPIRCLRGMFHVFTDEEIENMKK